MRSSTKKFFFFKGGTKIFLFLGGGLFGGGGSFVWGKFCRGGDLPEGFLRWGKGRNFLGGGIFGRGTRKIFFLGSRTNFGWVSKKFFWGGSTIFLGGNSRELTHQKKKPY